MNNEVMSLNRIYVGEEVITREDLKPGHLYGNDSYDEVEWDNFGVDVVVSSMMRHLGKRDTVIDYTTNGTYRLAHTPNFWSRGMLIPVSSDSDDFDDTPEMDAFLETLI